MLFVPVVALAPVAAPNATLKAPVVLLNSAISPIAVFKNPVVLEHSLSLATPLPAKTRPSVLQPSKTTPPGVLQVEAEQLRSAQTRPLAAKRSSPTLPAAPIPR